VSLWTPDGEHPVDRGESTADAPPAGSADPGGPSFDDLSPEEQARAEEIAAEIAETRERIAETPANVVVANHAMGLYELAAIHLGAQPPQLVEAAVAIDAFAGIVDALPERLGENEAVLRQALQQIRMAYVELSAAPTDTETGVAADESETTDDESEAAD